MLFYLATDLPGEGQNKSMIHNYYKHPLIYDKIKVLSHMDNTLKKTKFNKCKCRPKKADHPEEMSVNFVSGLKHAKSW